MPSLYGHHWKHFQQELFLSWILSNCHCQRDSACFVKNQTIITVSLVHPYRITMYFTLDFRFHTNKNKMIFVLSICYFVSCLQVGYLWHALPCEQPNESKRRTEKRKANVRNPERDFEEEMLSYAFGPSKGNARIVSQCTCIHFLILIYVYSSNECVLFIEITKFTFSKLPKFHRTL